MLVAKETITPKNGGHYIFLIADGAVKLSGRDHGIRKSTSLRDQLARSEDLSGDLSGKFREVLTNEQNKDDAEGRNDFWSIEGDFIFSSSYQTS